MEPRLFAIGDIHGCYNSFRTLVEEKIRLVETDKLILLGDYIDRGQDSKKVVDYIIGLQKSGFDLVALKGNHEAMLTDAFLKPENLSLWIFNGGSETLRSFGISKLDELNDEYVNFFKWLPYYYISDDYIFVHAGLNDNINNPFTDKMSMIWHCSKEYKNPLLIGKTIVHGHQTIMLSSLKERLVNKINVVNIDTGCVYAHVEGYGKLTAIELNSFTIVSV